MKKGLKYLSLIILATGALLAPGQVQAIDDWDSVYETYDDAQYGKVISEKDFQNAINAFKGYQKPDKKLQKKLFLGIFKNS